ncbi:serine protease [Actibacterium atlanticum]|uniref:Serine protease n=1 Tax=Actibacterium atlanticum TaxID=1461693 RepID=A0A058ZNL4_9RHOB|nr:trypsin-like peptidase domain-containing protein [Actibacterium atlanticum]KCV82752.1 serine protease [Actibacterium atlanticum]
MRQLLVFVIAIMMAQSAPAQQSVPDSQAQVTLSYAPVVRQAAPAVVSIYAKKLVAAQRSPFANDPFFGQLFRGQTAPRMKNSLGSGVILSPDGIVVTNFHVAGDSDQIRVVLNDRREFAAKVLLADEESDLAILALEGAQGLPALKLRDSDTMEVGDLVLAIGNPFGIGQTVSGGIVSGLARSNVSVGSGRGLFIQTDAAINPGNSGGALVDMQGRLVGVNTAILTRSGGSNGIGFAIPANLVARFVEQAEAGNTSFARPWAGISAQPVDASLAEALGMTLPEGVVITQLHPASPFRKAGLRTGDVILTIGNTPVNTPQEMNFRMSAEGIGGALAIEYLRKGHIRATEVAMMTAPDLPPREPFRVSQGHTLAGLTLVNVNPAVADELGLNPDTKGVLVLDPGAVVGRVGLRRGDVLLRINKTTIESTKDAERALRKDGRSWSVEYLRNGQRGLLRFRI